MKLRSRDLTRAIDKMQTSELRCSASTQSSVLGKRPKNRLPGHMAFHHVRTGSARGQVSEKATTRPTDVKSLYPDLVVETQKALITASLFRPSEPGALPRERYVGEASTE